jgi:hypothetical protein
VFVSLVSVELGMLDVILRHWLLPMAQQKKVVQAWN